MNLLLDTHVVVWWRARDKRLGDAIRDAIAAADDVLVSTVSAWEAGIKISKKRLKLPEPFEEGVADSGFRFLAVTERHTPLIATLPPHHGDPFDRMLVAQALVEGLTLVTADPWIARYAVPQLKA